MCEVFFSYSSSVKEKQRPEDMDGQTVGHGDSYIHPPKLKNFGCGEYNKCFQPTVNAQR